VWFASRANEAKNRFRARCFFCGLNTFIFELLTAVGRACLKGVAPGCREMIFPCRPVGSEKLVPGRSRFMRIQKKPPKCQPPPTSEKRPTTMPQSNDDIEEAVFARLFFSLVTVSVLIPCDIPPRNSPAPSREFASLIASGTGRNPRLIGPVRLFEKTGATSMRERRSGQIAA